VNRAVALSALFICGAAVMPAGAYPIFLKDGTQIDGTILKTENNTVFIETRYGVLQFDKDFIKQVSSAPEPESNAPQGMEGRSAGSFRPRQGFRFSVDMYGQGNAYKTIKNTFETNLRDLAAAFGHAEGSFDVEPAGVGLTAGFVFLAPKDQTLEHGPQVQFLSAPDVKLKLRVTDASGSTVYADESDTVHANMWRLTWMFGVPVKIADNIYFMPRADVGALFGKIYFENDAAKQTWSGMTFSLSPSLLIGKPRSESGAHFEVGASYTYIPTKAGSESFDTFEWSALGIHLGALWML
jgi:hypothetical protein